MSNTGINEVQKLSSEFCYWLHIPFKLSSQPKNRITTRAIKMVNRIKFTVTGQVSTLANFGLRATGHNEMEEEWETQIYDERRA